MVTVYVSCQVLPGVEVTVGQDEEQNGKWPYAGTASAIESMGGKHINKEIHVSLYYTSKSD